MNTISQNLIQESDAKELHDIESGKYRNHYLIYNRKSTDELDNQKNSIKYQKLENTKYAMKNNLSIAPVTLKGFCRDGIISEKHSGYKEDFGLSFGKNNMVQYRVNRPKFYKLMEFIGVGYFKGIIFLCWDRASRNEGDDTIINKLIRQGADIQFTLANYSKTSSGELHMRIDGSFAYYHSRQTSEKVKLTIRNKREQGIYTARSPVGYIDTGNMENKPIDPIRGPILKAMFERYATGQWSLADICVWATEQGFTMKPARRRRTEDERLAEEEDEVMIKLDPISRPATPNKISKMFRNRFYLGEMVGNYGTWIKSNSHEALVSKELFDKVQQVLKKRYISVYNPQKIEYPMRGMIRCKGCNRIYTPYEKKGFIYLGVRCINGCINTKRNINLDILYSRIEVSIKKLMLTDEEIREIKEFIKSKLGFVEKKLSQKKSEDERRMRKLHEDLTYLENNKLTLLQVGVYTPETIMNEENRLKNSINELEGSLNNEVSPSEIINSMIELSELLKKLYLLYKKSDFAQKYLIARKIFSELFFFENTLETKAVNGLSALETRFVSDCALSEWISELKNEKACIDKSINELAVFIEKA